VNLWSVFRIPTIRESYAKFRFVLFRKLFSVRSESGLLNVSHAQYSLDALNGYVSIADRITFLVSCVDSARRRKKEDLLLSLGPRFEAELFGFRAIGYNRKNIFALDSNSYSKLMSVGNMHNMHYENSFFDIVVGGWILAYSEDPLSAIDEIFRVTKPGGLAVLSWDMPLKSPNGSLDYKDLHLVYGDGKSISLDTLRVGWEVKSLFTGNTSWSHEVEIALVVLQKPFN